MTTRISLHNIKSITKKIHVSKNTGVWVELTATDKQGNQFEITFFGEKLKELSFIDTKISNEMDD